MQPPELLVQRLVSLDIETKFPHDAIQYLLIADALVLDESQLVLSDSDVVPSSED